MFVVKIDDTMAKGNESINRNTRKFSNQREMQLNEGKLEKLYYLYRVKMGRVKLPGETVCIFPSNNTWKLIEPIVGKKKRTKRKKQKIFHSLPPPPLRAWIFAKLFPSLKIIQYGEARQWGRQQWFQSQLHHQPTLNKLETKFPPFINRNIKCTISNTLGWPRK